MARKKEEEELSPLGLRRKLRAEGATEEEAKVESTQPPDNAEEPKAGE